jgi:outer membrane putative beta-barrel porin/alpha-amylase
MTTNTHHLKLSSAFKGLILFALQVKGLFNPCLALEPTPRQWNHLPIDTNFIGTAYANASADIFVDPVLLMEDVEMESEIWAAKYIRTFEVFDKTARIDLTQGYQDAEWTGILDGVQASAARNGLTDTFVRFAVNLFGAPPLKGKDYRDYRSGKDVETIVGMGLAVRLPTGDYKKDKLLNISTNRFAFRPQLGVIHNRGKWTAELTGEVAVYTENDEFWNGNKLETDPLYFVHAHLLYSFRPGLWVSASAGYDYGAENTVNGVDKGDTKQDILWAFSFVYPINQYAGFKAAYIGTRTQESVGFDSDIFSAGFSIAW